MILEVVTKNFKDHLILGEEGGLIGDSSSEYLWCIDPLGLGPHSVPILVWWVFNIVGCFVEPLFVVLDMLSNFLDCFLNQCIKPVHLSSVVHFIDLEGDSSVYYYILAKKSFSIIIDMQIV